MNTLLIMNLFLYANSPQAGAGAGAGMSVATEKFQTIEQCETAKKAFMNMRVSAKELGAYTHHSVSIVRKAECVALNSSN